MNAFKVKNERKLLVKNNAAYSVRRFSAFPFYRDGQGQVVFTRRPALTGVPMNRPHSATARKNRLKKKCAVQDRLRSTPPQEQGTSSQKPASARPTYPVNIAMSAEEKTSPLYCHLLWSSKAMAASSATGTSQTRASATSGGKCWLCISWRNWPISASLLMTAYAKSRTSRAEAIGRKDLFMVERLFRQRKAALSRANSGKWVVYPSERHAA